MASVKYKPISCAECLRRVSQKTGVTCSLCQHTLHPRCTKLNKQELHRVQNNPSQYICNFCQNFKCGKCNKAVHRTVNALQCEADTCGTWFHLKCTKISLPQYNEFNRDHDSPPWFCTDCLCAPFFSINNNDLKNILFDSKLEKHTRKILKSNEFKNNCPICTRKIASDKIAKALPCFSCHSLTHRKCSGLSNYELNNSEPQDLAHWQCTKCHQDAFPCINISDEELIAMSFNSNFDCKCQTTCDNLAFRKSLILDLSKFKQDKMTDGPDPDCHLEHAFDINIEFDYYNTHQFHKLTEKLSKTRPPLTIYHTNIQSLQCNIDRLHTQLADLDYPFDIIALSETWNPSYKKDNFLPGSLPGYKKYNGTEGTSLKGGCGFFVKETLRTFDRHDLSESFSDNNNEFQSKWIEITIPKTSNILIAVYYRHPKKTSNSVFNEHLQVTLEKVKKENKEVFIAGDFNYDLLKFSDNKLIDDFLSDMFVNFLQPCIPEPTRIVNGNKPSLVDNIFSNAISKQLISGNLLNKLSDHMPNFVIAKKITTPHSKEKRKIRDTKNLDETQYRQDLHNIDITATIAKSDSINPIYNEYHDKLLKVYDKHAPYKYYSRKEMRWKQKPWITAGIQKSIRVKNLYYGKYVRTKNQFWYKCYRHYVNAIKRLTFASKRKYYTTYFNQHAHNSRKVWKGINEILRKNSKMANEEIFLNEDGLIITDQKRVADRFNHFFTNVADNLISKISNSNTEYQDYLKNPNESSIFIKEVDFGEVYDLVRNLDITKAGDIYDISPKLLQIGAQEISPNLTAIYNLSLKFGEFPDKLKIAKIIPVFKADSKLQPGNYRPISLLPIIGKVFERLVYNRVYSFISKMNILTDKQYGFQKGKATEHALLELQSKIIYAIEHKLNSCCIFLDFAKAFDTVNHNILLDKLYHYGIRGTIHDWFKSYLSNRQQCVQVNGHLSEFTTVRHGVPQGSILGPLLFLLYINDIVKTTPKLEFLLFADDTSIFLSGKDLKSMESTLNTELDNISNWLKANKLSLNIKKSNILVFRNRVTKQTETMDVKIDGNSIDEKTYAKYLGLLIDNKLTFKNHIDYVHTKLKKGNAILARLRYFVPKENVRNVYYAHIESHLNYGSLVWGSAANYHVEKIVRSQKKSIKIMNFVKAREHIDLPFKNNKILPFDQLRALSMCKFIWKMKNNITPFLDFLLQQNQVVKSERDDLKYLVPFKNTRNARLSLFYAGFLVWNKIPQNIQKSASVTAFSRNCKEFLLSKLK